MQINIINQMNQDAYLQFGLAAPDGTYAGASLAQNTPYTIAANSTLTGMSLTDFVSGKMFFSIGTPLTFVGNAAPDFQFGSSDPNTYIRWDKIEMTLYDDPTKNSAANLTATDFFSLRLQLETFATATSTTPTTTLTTRDATADVFAAVKAIAGNDPADINYAIVPGNTIAASGAGVLLPDGSSVLRVIAPSTVPPPGVDDYASPQAYVTKVQTDGVVTHVTGLYTNLSGSGATAQQNYDFLASIPTTGPNAGALVMIGSGSVVGPNQTIVVKAADLLTGIVTQNPNFYVNGSTTADTFGNNDVYGAAVRDMLGGFGFGFVDSTAINPNTGHAYRDDATSDWYNPQAGLGVAFSYAQPSNPTFYSQYAAVFGANANPSGSYVNMSDAYGFPYTDLLGAPLADITSGTVDHIDITILSDSVSPPPCFVTGTPIMTTQGEIAVEDLAEGMELPTQLGGASARIRWIGHRTVDCAHHPKPATVRPVRVRRDAFGPGMPHRDIRLSPDHAVLVDDVLIPIRYLENGVSIMQEAAGTLTYWHVELDRHDVIRAAGLPAESFLDTGNKSAFANGGPVVMAHPDFHRLTWEAQGCAPLVVTGPALHAARAALLARAQAGSADPDWMGVMRPPSKRRKIARR